MVAERRALQFGNQSQSLPAKQISICEKWLSAGEEKLSRYRKWERHRTISPLSDRGILRPFLRLLASTGSLVTVRESIKWSIALCG
jgi:hypothetical protein